MIEAFCAQRGLVAPPGLIELHAARVKPELQRLVFSPSSNSEDISLERIYHFATKANNAMPANLLPIMSVDRRSLACVVATPVGMLPLKTEGFVVRWHADINGPRLQYAELDISVMNYVEAIADELRSRNESLSRVLDEIGPAYTMSYIDEAKRPRDFVLRPVRLASQNVIVGVAAYAQDSAIDGLSVVAWQTCEVAHLAAHESNRGLIGLILCDAYKNGGTMEIRFDRPLRLRAAGISPRTGKQINLDITYAGHPEGRVPAAIRRYGRTVGVGVGVDDPASISPNESRRLFRAVSKLPEDLQTRVDQVVRSGAVAPERFCYIVMAQVWKPIEIDFMLATSDRTVSIIQGGSDFRSRTARQAESEISRTALMVGMLYGRLDTNDQASGNGEVRVIEGSRVGVEWTVLPEVGGVALRRLRGEPLPWQSRTSIEFAAGKTLIALPRLSVSTDDIRAAAGLRSQGQVAIVVPRDTEIAAVDLGAQDIALLRCPDRLGQLDQAIEAKLLAARISRA